MIFFPGCKVNIGLDVLRRRADGFHDIETLMLPVTGLCDILEIVPSAGSGAELSVSGIAVDCPPDRNLCMRAYGLMRGRFGIGGVRMHLHKVVPFGAGLGGGSSDAASVIKGLGKVFSLGLDMKTMEGLAAELGSDAAFFVRNEPRMAAGRGEILTPHPAGLGGKLIVIVKPDIQVSTAEAYAGITPRTPETPLKERLSAGIATWKDTVVNAFEPSVFARHPELAQIKESLYNEGALYASMSGSGSAVYGIFEGGDAPRPDYATAPEDPRAVRIRGLLEKRFGKLFVYQQVID